MPLTEILARTPLFRRASTLALATLLAFQAGCTSLEPKAPRPELQATLGRVAVVAAPVSAEIRLEGFPGGPVSGAVQGAAGGFVWCLAGAAKGSCTGAVCGATAVLAIGVCGVAAAVGAAAGAAAAPSPRDVERARESLLASLSADTVQTSLRDEVLGAAAARGPALPGPSPAPGVADRADYRALRGEGIDTVLEVSLTEVRLQAYLAEGHGLRMEARARLVRTLDDGEAHATAFTHLGPRMPLSAWWADGGKALLQALADGYAALGNQIDENVFILFPFPDRQPHGAGFLSAAFGLAPIEPPTRAQLVGAPFVGDALEWVKAAGSRPTLRWESFPRASDRQADPEAMGRVRRVRYDLLVWREANLAPAELVYRREGLPEAEHRLETRLASGTRHFWTVRARFELDGRERVTEWGVTHFRAFGAVTPASPFAYRFRTP